MKHKLFLLALFASLLVGCAKESAEVVKPSNIDLESADTHRVRLSKALEIAAEKVGSLDGETRSTPRVVKSTELYIAKHATRSGESSNEVSFYIINYEDNGGFALVSTDSRTTPIYAYSDRGSLSASDFEESPGLQIFMEGAIPYYEDEIANYSIEIPLPPGPLNPIIPDSLDDGRAKLVDGEWCWSVTHVVNHRVNPLLSTIWHQGFPYNYVCEQNTGTPDVKVGCGPVAIGQIAAYHRHPATFNGYTFHWDEMLENDYIPPHDITSTASVDIGNLLWLIGDAGDAEYGENKTSMTTNNTLRVLGEMGYTCSNVQTYNSSSIINQISNSLPVFVGGTRINENNQAEAHVWVIDGYEYDETIVRYYIASPPYRLHKTTSTNSAPYLNCNLGEEFFVNMYLLETDFQFKLNKYMIINIEPDI